MIFVEDARDVVGYAILVAFQACCIASNVGEHKEVGKDFAKSAG